MLPNEEAIRNYTGGQVRPLSLSSIVLGTRETMECVRGNYLGQRVTTGSRHFVQNVERKKEKTCLINPCNVQDLGVFMYMLDGQTL